MWWREGKSGDEGANEYGKVKEDGRRELEGERRVFEGGGGICEGIKTTESG